VELLNCWYICWCHSGTELIAGAIGVMVYLNIHFLCLHYVVFFILVFAFSHFCAVEWRHSIFAVCALIVIILFGHVYIYDGIGTIVVIPVSHIFTTDRCFCQLVIFHVSQLFSLFLIIFKSVDLLLILCLLFLLVYFAGNWRNFCWLVFILHFILHWFVCVCNWFLHLHM